MTVWRILAAALAAILLVVTVVQASLGHRGDQVQLAVAVENGAPIRASVSFLAQPGSAGEQAGSGALVTTILDTRGLASGWTVRLETHGGFQADTITGIDRYGHAFEAITVRQGNRNLVGHSVIQYGSVVPNDAFRWTTIRHFGDGEYDLLLTGSTTGPVTVPRTVTLSISGSAP